MAKVEFDEVAKKFIEVQQILNEYEPLKKEYYNRLQAIVKDIFDLKEVESQGKYQTLKYCMEFKKASESETINKDLLKEKYPEIYAEVVTVKTSKPALNKIYELQV